MDVETRQRREGSSDLPVLVFQFPSSMRAISSAPFGGGIGERNWVLNAQVPSDYARPDPDQHVEELARTLGLTGAGVGMLTSVDVRRGRSACDGGVEVWATVGVTHPILAAAPEEQAQSAAGTINILAIVPEKLSDAALVNAVATATEAKTQALLDAGFHATGTVTDAVCVVCPTGGREAAYGGPRSLWGSRLARATHAAVLGGARA